MIAADDGHDEIVEILLSASANSNARHDNGWTALMWAANYGHAEIAKLLLSAGANPNARDKQGWTALMLAASEEKSAISKLLLECGANPNLENDDGTSAWDWARQNLSILPVFEEWKYKFGSGWRPRSCKGRWWSPRQSASDNANAVATKPPQAANVAERVFENVWRSVVVVKSAEMQGSGVIVRPNVVATNCHVVESGGIAVYKHDNRRASTDTTYRATIRKRDNVRDFCLLDVRGLNGNAATVRRYNTLGIGESVYAVGSPQGFDLSLSSGLISQLRQGGGKRWIQTDAAFSPGSSGGGLFDSDGNLIGITTEKIVDEEVEGIGFAIPADLVLGN